MTRIFGLGKTFYGHFGVDLRSKYISGYFPNTEKMVKSTCILFLYKALLYYVLHEKIINVFAITRSTRVMSFFGYSAKTSANFTTFLPTKEYLIRNLR